MSLVLLIDFGSTYTKVTAVDREARALLGTAAAYTTVATDINEGLEKALADLQAMLPAADLKSAQRFACSSAAGGLRMVTSGLVPALTAEAARLASLGAGAKVVKVFSYELTEEDIEEIDSLRPDIFLLTGGTDGGNKACSLHNAAMLARCKRQFPILIAGNRSCAKECETLLAGREVYRCENVMPRMNQLNIEPVQNKIREIFLHKIIQAKGLSQARELISGILMPTPAALLAAMELLAKGTAGQEGLGDLMAVDLGGATTDVYSMAQGLPQSEDTVMKGLPEPYAKRSVEGDIGMRYSAGGILAAAGADKLAVLSGLSPGEVEELVDYVGSHTDVLPQSPGADPRLAALDFALAAAAVETAVTRHAGSLEQIYTPMGLSYIQTGKDLRDIKQLVATGGAIIHTENTAAIINRALYSQDNPFSLKPKKVNVFIDRRYILSAMGLLADKDPDCALAIMREELEFHGA
ncbi:MAG: methylaspartate mutase accessory protein GlmL [Clostridiales bacterium]